VGRAEPLAMTFICNAGIIAPDMWVHDPLLGGGRIIGEACHYIDLLSFIAGSPIITVAAVKMGEGVAVRDDKMAIILGFADGSIGNVNYFGNGNKAYPKEVLEVYSEGRVLRLDNFRKLEGYGFKGFRKMKGKMDKGHVNEFRSFIKNVNSGGAPLIVFEDLINTTLASFAAVTAAEENRKIILSEEYKGFGKAENRFR
jgi:predicted dehydrogenase